MADHESITYYLYQVFYRKLYGNEKYLFIPSVKQQKLIENFIITIDKKYHLESVGLNFLISYFIFQFSYNSKLKVVEKAHWSNRIQLSWIIGDKAFKRWLDRDTKFDWILYESNFFILNDIL